MSISALESNGVIFFGAELEAFPSQNTNLHNMCVRSSTGFKINTHFRRKSGFVANTRFLTQAFTQIREAVNCEKKDFL